MSNNILKLLKKRSSAREYINKPIPESCINKIVEAGRWGPAIHHIQPWEFVIVKDDALIKRISSLILKKMREMDLPGFIFYPSIAPLSTARALIFVYNTKEFANMIKKIRKIFFRRV